MMIATQNSHHGRRIPRNHSPFMTSIHPLAWCYDALVASNHSHLLTVCGNAEALLKK